MCDCGKVSPHWHGAGDSRRGAVLKENKCHVWNGSESEITRSKPRPRLISSWYPAGLDFLVYSDILEWKCDISKAFHFTAGSKANILCPWILTDWRFLSLCCLNDHSGGIFTYLRFSVSAVVWVDVCEVHLLRAQRGNAAVLVEWSGSAGPSVLHGPCVWVTVTQRLQPHWHARAWATVHGHRLGNTLHLGRFREH